MLTCPAVVSSKEKPPVKCLPFFPPGRDHVRGLGRAALAPSCAPSVLRSDDLSGHRSAVARFPRPRPSAPRAGSVTARSDRGYCFDAFSPRKADAATRNGLCCRTFKTNTEKSLRSGNEHRSRPSQRPYTPRSLRCEG